MREVILDKGYEEGNHYDGMGLGCASNSGNIDGCWEDGAGSITGRWEDEELRRIKNEKS